MSGVRKILLFVFVGLPLCTVQAGLPDSGASQLLLDAGVEEIVFSIREFGKNGHWYANIGFGLHGKMNHAPDGGGLFKCNLRTGGIEQVLKTNKGSVRDPAIHYDAKKMVFAWRKPNTIHYHLYESDLNGKNIRQLTDGGGDFDDIEPCYLPDGGIVFNSSRCKRIVPCLSSDVAMICRCDGDGKNVQQLSFNVEMDNTPWVLPDGRIIYMRWEYTDRSQLHFHHLWTMNPDGTYQMVYFGNMHPGGVFVDPKPIPGTSEIIYINSPGHGNRSHAGAPKIVTDSNGPDDLSADRFAGGFRKKSECYDPFPIASDLFIVSTGRDVVAFDRKKQLGTLFSIPESYGTEFIIQEPRPVMKRRREAVIPARTDWSQKTGKLILSDAYYGRNMKGVEKGDITRLMILEILPKPVNFSGGSEPTSWGGTFLLERILGTVPVEPDGSAFMELPANRPVFFVAVDKNGNAVKRMHSFTSVMPGETTSCIGCHEERKTAVPAKVALMALKKPAQKPRPVSGVPEIFDFPRDIQPILDKHCIKCHGTKTPKGGVSLENDYGQLFSLSYVNLIAKAQVADGRNRLETNLDPRTVGAVASPLIKKVDGSHHSVQLSPIERKLIHCWIESGAPYAGTYAALEPSGRVGFNGEQLPSAEAARQAIKTRCYECHQKKLGIETPLLPSEEEKSQRIFRGKETEPISMIQRETMFNFTRPELSLVLRAPLAKKEGGLATCGAVVFKTTKDPDYRAILKHIKAVSKAMPLRFDSPDYVPSDTYIEQLKRYEILPKSARPSRKMDVYELDRKYWESFWHIPKSGR